MYYIYRTTNLINGKTYIGQHRSKDIMNDKYIGSGKYFYKAVKKYGKANFKNEVIEVVESRFQANVMEKVWIKREKAKGKAEYNISWGGSGGDLGPEVRKKISNALKGKPLSEETKRKISETKKGKFCPKSYHWKINDTSNMHHTAWNKGKKLEDYMSEERIKEIGAKISNSNTGKPHPHKGVKGLKYFTNGEINVRRRECPEGFWPGVTHKYDK